MEMPPDEVKEGAPEWVVTFGDMMTLLLCFFVLLLSFSTMEAERFKIIAGYIREAFGVQADQRHTEIPAGDTVVTVEFNPPSMSKSQILESIVKMTQNMAMGNLVEASMEEDGVRVRLDGTLTFKPGGTTLTDRSMLFLDYVADLIHDAGASASVEGHTDNRPLHTKAFPSNWELSGARAGSVVRHLETRGIPGTNLEAIGYGSTRPITENFTAEGRRKNRRVEILIEPK